MAAALPFVIFKPSSAVSAAAVLGRVDNPEQQSIQQQQKRANINALESSSSKAIDYEAVRHLKRSNSILYPQQKLQQTDSNKHADGLMKAVMHADRIVSQVVEIDNHHSANRRRLANDGDDENKKNNGFESNTNNVIEDFDIDDPVTVPKKRTKSVVLMPSKTRFPSKRALNETGDIIEHYGNGNEYDHDKIDIKAVESMYHSYNYDDLIEKDLEFECLQRCTSLISRICIYSMNKEVHIDCDSRIRSLALNVAQHGESNRMRPCNWSERILSCTHYFRFPAEILGTDNHIYSTFKNASVQQEEFLTSEDRQAQRYIDNRYLEFEIALQSAFANACSDKRATFYVLHQDFGTCMYFSSKRAIVSRSTQQLRSALHDSEVTFEFEETSTKLIFQDEDCVHALYDFLLNFSAEKRRNDVPVILSERAFEKSTLMSCDIININLAEKTRLSNAHKYAVEISGLILPMSVLRLLEHARDAGYCIKLWSLQQEFGASGNITAVIGSEFALPLPYSTYDFAACSDVESNDNYYRREWPHIVDFAHLVARRSS